MRRRRLVITIPSDEYRHLTDMADREERAVDQQASFVLRQALQQFVCTAGSQEVGREAAN